MMLGEFETLTGIHPSWALWLEINRAYCASRQDKHEWCADYAANKDGMADKIARAADDAVCRHEEQQAAELKKAQAENKQLCKKLAEVQEQLDRELDWQPAKNIGTNMTEQDYAELADEDAPLTELDAIRRITQVFGFEMSRIRLIQTAQTFDRNKYGKCRVSGTYTRFPHWSSSDWNYIRFDVCGNQWEIVNGELLPYYD